MQYKFRGLRADGKGWVYIKIGEVWPVPVIPSTVGMWTGFQDAKGREVYPGDKYFEEIEQDEGDERTWFTMMWIKEWAMFAFLSDGELLDYEDNGVDGLDDSMRNSFILTQADLNKLHYTGNIHQP